MHPLLAARLEHDLPSRLNFISPALNGRANLLRNLCLAIHDSDPALVVDVNSIGFGMLLTLPGPTVPEEDLDPQTTQHAKLAEQESLVLCQRCGEDGRPARQARYWRMVLCQECMDMSRGDGLYLYRWYRARGRTWPDRQPPPSPPSHCGPSCRDNTAVASTSSPFSAPVTDAFTGCPLTSTAPDSLGTSRKDVLRF
uniref:ZZ-type domain-containing protein n=1 Tax=Mycena chlorophos TaxID=658473 RepID=A0ABQ0LGQ8_MYCCL|nr:predicted protein [Mycena chlorophos]